MRYLRDLDICGQNISVFLVTEEEMKEADSSPGSNVPEGIAKIEQGRILVRDNISADRQRDTLLHEIIHYLLEASGVGPNIEGWIKKPYEDKWEEDLIRLVTPWILHFISNNLNILTIAPAEVSGAV